MRVEYWSCSRFADIVRGTKKISSGTADEWDRWEEIAKKSHPIRFWLAEEMLDFIQSIIYYIPGKIHDIKVYITNRYVNKTHALTSNLSKGGFYELDTRMLHCLFDELVNFVECEKAHMEMISNPERYKKSRNSRNAQAGINYLTWEAGLVGEDGQPYQQALTAKWILDAYAWWTVRRPARPDPMDVSGWSAYCDLNRPLGKRDDDHIIQPMLAELTRIENEHHQEDTEMLIEFIKHRQGLWT
jgi:hypothetical protein